MNTFIRYLSYLLVGIAIVVTLLVAYPEGGSRAKAHIVAPNARLDPPIATMDKEVTKTTNFKPVPDGAKTWEWATSWKDVGGLGSCGDFEAANIDTSGYFPKVAGQITAGFLHHWDGGHWPIRCRERKTSEFVGTVWFDLNEIFSKPPLPKAEYAILTFKAIESDGPGGVCKDELRLPSDDWMSGLPANTLPKTGSLEPAVYFTGCPPAGCSFEVTSIVNNWITGREDRYGFAISGLDDLAAIGTDGGKNPDNNAHCTTRYGDFTLTVTYTYRETPETPKYIPPGRPPFPGGSLDTRKNCALSANGGIATASSEYDSNYGPATAINGDESGVHRGVDPATGSFWNSVAPGKTFPDWLEVAFSSIKKIDEIDVFTLQDSLDAPSTPAEGMTFSKYGLTEFEVQAWNPKFGGWRTVGSFSADKPNNKVWSKFNFVPSIQTTKIRVLTHASPDGYSRIVELEAWCK